MQIPKNLENRENYVCAILALYCMDELDHARELCETALAKWEDHLMLHHLSGNMYRRLREYGKTFSHWNRSLELNQKRMEETHENGFFDFLFSMAECYSEVSQTKEAQATWQRIADILGNMGFDVEQEMAMQKII